MGDFGKQRIILEKTIPYPAENEIAGGKVSVTVSILGRLRRVTKHRGRDYITYKGQKITLASAKKLEKKNAAVL